MSRQKELPARSAVPTELKWDLTLLYPDDQAMKDQLEQTVSQAHQLHQLAGHLGDDGETLLKALQMSKSIGEALEREYVYAFLRRDSDTTDAQATELYGVAEQKATEIETALSFMDPEIVKLDQAELDRWLKNVAGLDEFKFALHQIRLQRGHVLTVDEEQLLSRLSRSLDSADTIYNTLNDADLHFGKIKDENGDTVELTHGNRSQFTESTDREVRKAAVLAYQKP